MKNDGENPKVKAASREQREQEQGDPRARKGDSALVHGDAASPRDVGLSPPALGRASPHPPASRQQGAFSSFRGEHVAAGAKYQPVFWALTVKNGIWGLKGQYLQHILAGAGPGQGWSWPWALLPQLRRVSCVPAAHGSAVGPATHGMDVVSCSLQHGQGQVPLSH